MAVVASWSLTGAVLAHDQTPGEAQARPVLLRGGDLYTVANGVLEGTDLLFEDGRISRIGKNLDAPADATVVDVTGKRVYPGLIAAHTGLGMVEIGAVRATRDNDEVGDFTPEVEAHVAYNPDSEVIPTVRSHGITTAQVIPWGSVMPGRTFITHLDGWTKEDAALRLVDGLAIEWPRAAVIQAWWMSATPEEQRKRMQEEREALRRFFEEARAYHRAREADPAMPEDIRLEAMRPIVTGELPVYIEADDYRQIVEAVSFAAEMGVRMVLVGGDDAYQLTDLLKEHDIPVILGSTTERPAREDEDYDLAFRLPALLNEAGVRWCLSHPETWDTRNLPLQAGLAAGHGLSHDDALRSVTLSVAEILGVDAVMGSLEVGKHATLFVSEGDVLDLLGQKVVQMYIEGREIDLDNRHKELFRKYRAKQEQLGIGD